MDTESGYSRHRFVRFQDVPPFVFIQAVLITTPVRGPIMAKIVETVSDDAKAKARHAKIANEKKEAEEKEKNKISDEKWKARRAEERRKDEIKKLPKEERAAAKKELKEQIRHRKENEKKAKIEAREAKKAKREAEKQEAQAKAEGAQAHEEQKVEDAIETSEKQETAEETKVEEIAGEVQDTIEPTPAEEGVPGELPAETVEEVSEKKE